MGETGGGGWVIDCIALKRAIQSKGGSTALADRAWRLLQVAIEKACSALDGSLFWFLVQTCVENGPFTL